MSWWETDLGLHIIVVCCWAWSVAPNVTALYSTGLGLTHLWLERLSSPHEAGGLCTLEELCVTLRCRRKAWSACGPTDENETQGWAP